MLECHYRSPGQTVSYGQLAKAAGIGEANLVYGKFCRALGESLNFSFRPSTNRSAPYFGSAIGYEIENGPGEEFQLRMYPEVASALEMLGWYQMGILDELRPRKKSAVIELVEQAGISVDDWYLNERSEPVKQPRSNPQYCYNWSFGTAREGFVLCIWHQGLKTSAGKVVFDENVLEHGKHKQAVAQSDRDEKIRNRARAHAGRSFAFVDACDISYMKGLPIRVILNDGSRKDREDLENSSIVLQRELDPEPWYVHRFDAQTGDCVIVRGIEPERREVREGVVDGGNERDDHTLEGDDRRRLAEIRVRQKQGPFRDMLLAAYGRKCAVTGTRIVEILEAAHIVPHAEGANYRADNGLLLRADIHTLYDLHLLSIDERCRVHVSRTLRNTDYACFGGRDIHLPPVSQTPSFLALRRRHERFLQEELNRP